jgi:hypothetical protein
LELKQGIEMKKKFFRNIIFSKTPLKTHFRVGDKFQIYPIDFKYAPKSKKTDHIPLVIEYWIDEEENPEVSNDWNEIKNSISSTANQINRLNRITRLLSVVSNHRFFNYPATEIVWGMSVPEEITNVNRDQIDQLNSQPFIELYYYPLIAMDMEITDFVKQQHPASILLPHTYYYFYDPIESKEKQITFPRTVYSIFEKYFALDSKSRSIIDTVAHLICNGIDLKMQMKSLSFLSFVSGIETLANFEYKNQKAGVEFDCPDCQTVKSSTISCAKCGRPIWGVKAKFKTFLKTYVSESKGSEQKYNRIYNLRSNIVHNGLLLLGDEQHDWTHSDKADSQWKTHLETLQLSRLCLVNWLLRGPNKPAPDDL